MLIKESLQKERQISVDPISVKDPPVIITAPNVNGVYLPLPLLPAKPKFLSSSLPNSATSSPRFSSATLTKKSKNQSQPSPFSANSLSRQHSVALSRLARLRERHLERSKSCGEGRVSAPPDDFDLWLTKVNGSCHDNQTQTETIKTGKGTDSYDEEFKCGALCLFLPGFGKGKPVRARKEEPEMGHVISRTVSLEKFECGSWTSSAIIHDDNEEGESSKRFFDLPLELIRSSVNDADSPVRTAFVFDKDRKGVLKNNTLRGTGRKSHESSRHVRFSTSSPTSRSPSASPCITPRLRKAREDFNAFLEAQSA